MTIKVKLNKYSLDTSKPEDKKRYAEICETATKSGFKLMDCFNPGSKWDWLDSLPEEHTIETDCLFEDQYNTEEGFRIHDWYEELSQYNRTLKKGYYLSGDLAELETAKANQYICSYCGTRYAKDGAPVCCTKCLSSEYLTEDRLPMLQLQPVKRLKDLPPLTEAELRELKEKFEAERPKLKARMEKERIARLLKRAETKLADAKEEAATLLYEAEIHASILRAGIDTSNLIHYSHEKKWVWGWQKPLSAAEEASLRSELARHPEIKTFEYTINREATIYEKASFKAPV